MAKYKFKVSETKLREENSTLEKKKGNLLINSIKPNSDSTSTNVMESEISKIKKGSHIKKSNKIPSELWIG